MKSSNVINLKYSQRNTLQNKIQSLKYNNLEMHLHTTDKKNPENSNCFYTEVCPHLSLENGRVEYNKPEFHKFEKGEPVQGYTVNTMASFLCDTFYQINLNGSSPVICQNTGNWSGQLPTCDSSNE